jgi:CMP-N,N'-diacetyllegionaminic acid synthase
MKTIVIIPARGGSKGIGKKNIVDFCGKPLIAWSILQAIDTLEISEVFVSSDSDEILNVAKKYGAETIKRPESISSDTATSESVIEHLLYEIKVSPKEIIMIQPTSPLRKPDDLTKALHQFTAESLDSMFSGSMLNDFLIWKKTPEGILASFNYDFTKRGIRQEREPQYLENGSFYIFKPNIIRSGNRLGGKIGIYLMESWQSCEIDSFEDLELASILFNSKLKYIYRNNFKGGNKCKKKD